MVMNFVKTRNVKTPTYGTDGSAGMDFYLPEPYGYDLQPGLNKIGLGIQMEIPEGFVLILKEKSGLTEKHEMIKLAGVIDSDYRGEISAMYFYPKTEPAKILAGNKVVQGILVPVEQAQLNEVEKLSDTNRGEGGFGSTGE